MNTDSVLLAPEAPLGDDVDQSTLRFQRGPKALRLLVGEERCYIDVRLRLADPLRFPDQYISVIDRRDHEICLLDSLAGLDPASREIAEEELRQFYAIPTVARVQDLNIKHGPLYWRVDTDLGPREFVVKWSNERVLPLQDGSLRVTDVDGNRFHVPPKERLDAESRKRVAVLV
jgi:hypothetical protein